LRTESLWQICGDSKFLWNDRIHGLMVDDMAQGILADTDLLQRHFALLSL